MYFNPYALPVFASATIMVALALAAWKYRKTPGVRCFSMTMVAGAVYSFFYALEISSLTLPLVTLFYKFEYIGIPYISAFYLFFAIRYTERKVYLKPHILLLIFIIPVLTTILVFTNTYHKFFFSEAHLDLKGPFPVFSFQAGFWYWVQQGYSIVTIIFSSMLFLRMWLGSVQAFRKQTGLILLASLFPFIFYIIYLLGWMPWGLDPIPFSFSVAGLFAYLGLANYKLFNINPIARNLLFDRIPDAVLVFDEKFRYVDCNHAAAGLFCIKSQDTGKTLDDLLSSWPQLISGLKLLKNDDRTEVALVIGGGQRYFEIVMSGLTDESDRLRGRMLVLRDVTQQHLAELKRREIEEKFRPIVENAPLGIIYFDKQGTIRVCNDFFLKTLGTTREKIIGLNILLLPDKRVVKAVKTALNGIRSNFEGDYTALTSGKTTPVMAVFEAIYSEEGNITGGLGIIQDITERKEAEEHIRSRNAELQRLNAEKDRFFSIIAHDLRSPFNAFLGYTELMTNNAGIVSREELIEYAREIHKSAFTLFALLENLLEWSRIQQNMITVQLKSLLLQPLVLYNLDVFKEAARKKNISVEVNVPEELAAFADEKMLSSVLRNLISNAIKFTPRGGKIGINAYAYENQSVEVCISDNGVGISPDDIQRLFRIDEKVNSPGTENESSTGLGLILCKEFVGKMGGRIWAKSLENKGSDFHFTLPAPKKEEIKNEKSVKDNISMNEPMLLVAEDEDISFMVMKNFLKKTPIKVLRAKDGQEAVELCKRYPEIMLVLMDINMPVMNGFEATMEIKAFRKGLPVIAVTAYTSENAVEDAVMAGCDDFISKPVTKDTISTKLAMFGLNVI